MNSDEMISMHKACENVIAKMSFDNETVMSTQDQLSSIRANVITLAVIQRDLLKGVLQ